MDVVGRLAWIAADAVSPSPKGGWQDSLILACDDVEEEYDELLAALERIAMSAMDYMRQQRADGTTLSNCRRRDAEDLREIARAAIAKAKGGER